MPDNTFRGKKSGKCFVKGLRYSRKWGCKMPCQKPNRRNSRGGCTPPTRKNRRCGSGMIRVGRGAKSRCVTKHLMIK